ncbi:AMP-binding protein [Microbacterium sp. PRF11]|uniref:AMP-binding protein n=1 Tax=Microbacterium sp. PRF11 TaxID=2962593 RepID=UPI002881CBE5|nr:AMP-binding protein [Microbacterium sp. PRF11]MDT0116442.1 AMP-binding protein [Microbacterium sp. PRF11]
MTERTFSAILADRARAAPDAPLVIDSEGALTAAELDAAATAFAHALLDLGVGRDDTVAVCLPNGRDYVIACCGIWRAGATPQPMPTGLTASERAELEVVSAPVAAVGRRPVSPHIAWLPSARIESRGGAVPDAAASCWKAVATSGSTGRPKIVRAAAPASLDLSRPVASFLPRAGTQIVAGPLWHSAVFTYAFRGLLTGHRLVVLDRFEAARWVDRVEEHAVTWGLLVPTMMARLLRLPDTLRAPSRVTSLERVLHLGAPCAPALKRRFMQWLGPERVDEVYAGSESNGLTFIGGTEWMQRPGSVGRPVGGTEVRIRDESGAALAPGEAGAVWMRRGTSAAYAYLGALSRRDDEGWDTLGDVGYLDADGYLYLVDRADDLINRGGEKIAPAVVEAALESLPGVDEAVAFGVPDDDLGEVVHAAVRLTVSARIDRIEAQIRARLGARAPVALHPTTADLRNEAGKTRRSELAARFAPTGERPPVTR